MRRSRARSIAAAVLASCCGGLLVAQIAENPQDPTGVAIPYPLVHLVHSRSITEPGTSGHLRAMDPFLFFQLGRDLLHRQFQLRHGAYGQAGSLSVPLYVGPSERVHGGGARFARDHAASCGMCHSSVYREPAAGQTIASTGGLGRNTTHFYGAGLIEMLGEQIRTMVLLQYDENRNGVLDRAEVAGPRPVLIRPSPEAAPIDYGDLSPGADGVPRLNTLFRVWYLDAEGEVLEDTLGLDDPRVAAYDFAVQPFGWGRGTRRIGKRAISEGGEAATTREFYTVAADFHMGLQADDPTQRIEGKEARGAGGRARTSLNGAQQFDFGGAIDQGRRRTPTGISLDDPDGDGHVSELTEGDVDAIEFYILHTPAPAVRPSGRSEEGRLALQEIGCTRCHVESWRIEGRDDARGLKGDRRLFHLETSSRVNADGVTEVVGRLVPRWRVLPSGEHVPSGEPFLVERIYTDFKHWDIGPAFHERRFDGSLQRAHRTAPLWGVASTAPYGHSGRFLTLEAAILAHGGAAAAEAEAFRKLPEARRELLVDYLRSLVLYPTDEIPCDVDGDGKIAGEFEAAGQKVGYERFDARFLFRVPPRYKEVSRVIQPDGRVRPLLLIENAPEAHGLKLPRRMDSDGDGFPDAVDPLPGKKGLRDEQGSR
jgi:hypothetical protein